MSLPPRVTVIVTGSGDQIIVNTGVQNIATTASYAITASFAQQVIGFIESSSYSAFANTALSSAYAPTNQGVISSSIQVDYNDIQNQPTTIATASYVQGGNVKGVVSSSLSSSYALSSSHAQTASFASSTPPEEWATILNKPTGLVSSSLQVNYNDIQNKPTVIATASFIEWTGVNNKPVGLVSSSAQITFPTTSSYAVTASYSLVSQFAVTASYADNAGASEWGDILNIPAGIISSSAQVDYDDIQNQPTTVSTASYVDWPNIDNIPSGLLSSSAQIDFPETASYALTASLATSINFIPLTASYALTAGATGGGLVGDGVANAVAKFASTNGLTTSSITDDATSVEISVPVTASAFSGDGAGITGVISSSYALTSSYAQNVFSGEWDDVANKPVGLVSSSAQISFPETSSYAVTAAYAENASGGDWDDITNKPVGLVSSSAQITFPETASYAVTAAYAETIPDVDWGDINNIPTGIVSSSIQIDYNSIQNQPTTIATASYIALAQSAISASYSTTASYIDGGFY